VAAAAERLKGAQYVSLMELVGQHARYGRPVDDRRGLVLEGVKPKVVKVADVPESQLWVHDETDAGAAAVLAQLWAPDYPIPLGVFTNRTGETTYEEILIQQERKVISERGPGDIGKLLMSGETWKIG